MAEGRLDVSVVSIRCEGKKATGKCKVYAVVICGTEAVKCTPSELSSGVAPVQQTMAFTTCAQDDHIAVQVFEKHRLAADKLLGTAQVQLWSVMSVRTQQTTAPLIFPTDRQKTGTVEVRLAFLPTHSTSTSHTAVQTAASLKPSAPSHPASAPDSARVDQGSCSALTSRSSSGTSSASVAAPSSSYGVGGYHTAPGAQPPPFPSAYTPAQYPVPQTAPPPRPHQLSMQYPVMAQPGHMQAPIPAVGYPVASFSAAGSFAYTSAGCNTFNAGAGWEMASAPAVQQQQQQQGGSFTGAAGGGMHVMQAQPSQQRFQQQGPYDMQHQPFQLAQSYQPQQQQQQQQQPQ